MSKILHENFSYPKVEKELRDLLSQIAEVKQRGNIKVLYEGEEILSASVLAISFNIQESFSRDNIKRSKEQGRDKIDIFINKVFQLGYSVGIESNRKYQTLLMTALDDLLKANKKI